MAAAAELGYALVPHLSYSLDLAPSDFFLFKLVKEDPRDLKFECRVVVAVGSALHQYVDMATRTLRKKHPFPPRSLKKVH